MKAKKEGDKGQEVRNLFKKEEARRLARSFPAYPKDLMLRVYTSRLIGANQNLVLHGGGNTSVKLTVKNLVGEDQEVLFVKGSGVDLGTIEPEGFVGLDLAPLRRLRGLERLPDEEMENQLLIRKISARSPDPSVEALLHAFLPHRFVDHTHADAILTLSNRRRGTDLLREALGPRAGILPYLMSGFALAKGVFKLTESRRDIDAVIVVNHGIFTFGDDAVTSYERMIGYVRKADAYLARKAERKPPKGFHLKQASSGKADAQVARICQVVRGACAYKGNDGRLWRFHTEARIGKDLKEISLSRDAGTLCRSVVLTPDHVIWTKNRAAYLGEVPEEDASLKRIVQGAVQTFRSSYEAYFRVQVTRKKVRRTALDPYPRIFLVKGLGLIALGKTRTAARIAADIAEHAFRASFRARGLGAHLPISDSHIFDMEYWGLQQKKLGKEASPLLQGQIAVVTGGGGVIGWGIADRLLAAGAAVVISDIDESRLKKVYARLSADHDEKQIETIVFDVTQYRSVEKAFQEIGRRLGGIDLVVPNAGIAHVARIEELAPEKLDQVIAVNFKGVFNVIKASIPIFRRQGTGGNIVVISSKNVFDPGAAFGAYSASKAGAHQISKIAALELAELGVRVNLINPDAIFGDAEVSSKLWETIGPERMRSRGLDPQGLREYYRQRNLLKIQVLAEHVGNAVVFFASDQTPTTGASLPVDGGVPAAFPR